MEIKLSEAQVERMLCLYDFHSAEDEPDHFYDRLRKAVYHYQDGKRVYTDLQEWLDNHLNNAEVDSGEDCDSCHDIRRDDEVPEWCSLGEWVYSIRTRHYSKIIESHKHRVTTTITTYTDEYINAGNVVPARLRPYNAAEMHELLGKALTRNSDRPFSFLVIYVEGDGSFIKSGNFKYTAEELKDRFTIGGKPCGVLEHLTDWGDWVE